LNGSVPMERIDDMVTRIVATWYQVGQDKWPEGGPNFSSWTYEEVGKIHEGSPSDKTTGVVNKYVSVPGNHHTIALNIAAEGTVLVKNEGNILPLNRKGWKEHEIASQGQTKFRVGIFGEDARLSRNGINSCEDQSCNDGTLASGWGSGAASFPYLREPLSDLKMAWDSSNDAVYVTDWPENKLPKQKEILEDQDLCVVFANSDAGEGMQKWSGMFIIRVSCGG
jgi:hypothetical protein